MMKKVAQGDNVHIVKMVGCVSAQSPYALLLEYVPYGSLLDYLRENRKLVRGGRVMYVHTYIAWKHMLFVLCIMHVQTCGIVH